MQMAQRRKTDQKIVVVRFFFSRDSLRTVHTQDFRFSYLLRTYIVDATTRFVYVFPCIEMRLFV